LELSMRESVTVTASVVYCDWSVVVVVLVELPV
jgi:hypothetical protein